MRQLIPVSELTLPAPREAMIQGSPFQHLLYFTPHSSLVAQFLSHPYPNQLPALGGKLLIFQPAFAHWQLWGQNSCTTQKNTSQA